MARVKRGVTTHARHQKVIKAAKGYYGARRKLFGVALQAVEKASAYKRNGKILVTFKKELINKFSI